MTRRAFMVGLCGGSGMAYGLRLVEALLGAGSKVHVAATPAALRVLRHECGLDVGPAPQDLARLWPQPAGELCVHAPDAVEAAPSSGSAGIEAVILCPCSMGTLARVAHGFSSNLIERAADVALKERRPLIVVPRETPLSAIHLRNLLLLAEAGATVLPAMPGFYHRPQSVQELVDFVVARILERLQIGSPLIRRWTTPPPAASPWQEGEEP